MLPFIVAAALVAPTFLLWAYVHELCHVVMADHLVGVKFWSINVIPHRYKNSWRWASCTYSPMREATPSEAAAIYLAPRLANVVPLVCFPFMALFHTEMWPSWVVVFGGGLVDLAVGSMGWRDHSDLRRASKALGASSWWLRAAGWLALTASVGTAVAVALYK